MADGGLRTALGRAVGGVVACGRAFYYQPHGRDMIARTTTDDLKLDPLVELFPAMSDDEFAALVEDIRRHGVLQPITVRDGRIIDGRHRWLACQQLGINCPTVEWNGGDDHSATAYVVALNLNRRHLSKSQRAAIAVDLLPHLEHEAKQRQGARRRAAKFSDGTKCTTTKPTDMVEQVPQHKRGRSRDHAASALDVNPRYVSIAKKLKRDDPQAFAQVREGKATLNEAKRRRHERARQERREANAAKVEACPTIEAAFGRDVKFSTIVADPPWCYSGHNLLDRAMMDYATMPLAEIAAMPVADMADDDAHCYLWCTNRTLTDAHDVLAAWGFSYRSMLTWCKPGLGMGQWFRSTTEHVLFGVRGSQPLLRQDVGTWFTAPRGQHSAKPDVFYELVESCSPGPHLELFSRRQRPGWTAWGEVSAEYITENAG